jgi:RNA polymerase sigma factor (sigma-70 family)
MVRKYVLKNNGNLDNVKDLYHESIITFIENIKQGKIDASKNIDGFFYTIAKNKWINENRKINTHKGHESNLIYENSEFELDSHQLLMNKEIQKSMSTIMDQLGDKCKELIESYIFKGLPMDQIAQELGYLSRDTVKSKFYKCKQEMKQRILKSAFLKETLL